MLNHTQISCNNFAAEELKSGKDIASTLQLPDGRILEDKRTDADILKEVYFLICGIVPRKYSELISQYIHRDATMKEVKSGVWQTASKIKEAVKLFRKQNISDGERRKLDEITDLTPTKPPPGEAFIGLGLDTFSSAPLPALTCNLAMAEDPTARVNCHIVCDTGSSHPSVPYNILKRIKGFRDDMINKELKFKLTTPTSTCDDHSIMGVVDLALTLYDDTGTEHQLALQALVLRTNLPTALLDVNFLRRHGYTIGMRHGVEQLKLQLQYKYKKKNFYFSTQRQSLTHSKNVFCNISEVQLGTDNETLVRMRGHVLPGTYHGTSDDIENVQLHLSAYQEHSFDVNLMIKARDGGHQVFLPGELRLTCEPSPDIFNFSQNSKNSSFARPSQNPNPNAQDLGGTPSPKPSPMIQSMFGQVRQPSSPSQNPNPGPSAKSKSSRKPKRGESFLENEPIYTQSLEPIQSSEFTEKEIADMESITLPDGALEDLVYQRNGFYPGLDEEDTAEWPNFGSADQQEVDEMKKLIRKYERAFSKHKFEIGEFNGFEADIATAEGKSVHQKERDHAPQVMQEALPLIDGLLRANVVRWATPEEVPNCWTSNFLIQQKPQTGAFRKNSKADKIIEREKRKERRKRGINENDARNKDEEEEQEEEKRYRFLVDLRSVNYLVKAAPTPVFSSLDNLHLRKSSKARYAICFDFCQSFFSIKINRKSQLKVGIWVDGKILLLQRIPQGLRSSSTVQQTVLQAVFGEETLEKFKREVNNKFDIKNFKRNLISFSDDFLYLAETKREILEAAEAILFCLQHHNMKISFSKTSFFQERYTFLGANYDLTDRSIKLSKARTDAIISWPAPRSINEIQSRLAQMAYFSSHLPAFKICAYPLYTLCREATMKNFGLIHLHTFNNLKFLFKLCITLTIPNPDYRLVLSSDASSVGMSSVSMQLNPDIRRLEVISLLSRLFSKGSLTRPILSKESLGVCYTLDKNKTLISAAKHPVILLTDSAVLQYAQNHKILSTPIQSFSLIMSTYRNVQLMHIPSAVNLCADLISRTVAGGKPRQPSKEEKESLENLNTNFMNPNNYPLRFTHKEISEILNTPPAGGGDCNSKKSFERANFQDSPISALEDILFSPPEQIFFQLGQGKISEVIRGHGLWQRIKQLKKTSNLTDNDIDKLRKKHKLEAFDLEIFKMMIEAEVEEPAMHRETPDQDLVQEESSGHPRTPSRTPPTLVACIHQPQNVHYCDRIYCQMSETSNKLMKNHEAFLRQVNNSKKMTFSGNQTTSTPTQRLAGTPGDRTEPTGVTSYEEPVISQGLPPRAPAQSGHRIVNVDDPDDPETGHSGEQEQDHQVHAMELLASAPTAPGQENNNADTIHLYPGTAERFINSMVNFLNLLNLPVHRQLIKKLKKFNELDFKVQLILYTRCIKILKGLIKCEETDNFSFCQIIPIQLSPDSDIRVERGEDSLKIYLKEDTIVKRGELRTFHFGVTFCLRKHWLYVRPSELLLRNTIHDLPEIFKKPFPHLYKSFIIPRKTVKILSSDCIFEIKGFQEHRFSLMRLEEPITTHTCDNNQIRGQIFVKTNIIPIQVDKYSRYIEDGPEEDFTEKVIINLLDIYPQTPGGQVEHDPLLEEIPAPPQEDIQHVNDEVMDTLDNGHQGVHGVSVNSLKERHLSNNLTFLNTMLAAKGNVLISFSKYFLANRDYRELYKNIQETQPDQFVIRNNLIYERLKGGGSSDLDLRLVLPRHVAHLVARHLHAAHGEHVKPGPLRNIFEKCFSQISKEENIFRITVEACGICLLNKTNYVKKQKMAKRTVRPLQPFETLVCDIASALPATRSGGHTSCLIGACALTGFAVAIPLKTNTSADMITAMKQVFQYYGLPALLITDYAQYWGSDFSIFLSRIGVNHYKINSKRSDEAGNAERLICLLRERLQKFCLSGDPDLRHRWNENLWSVLYSFNKEPRTGTKISRNQLFFGPSFFCRGGDFFEPDTSLINDELEKIQKLRDDGKKDVNNKKKFKPGSLVVKIHPTKTADIHENSRYLQQTGEVFEVLDSCSHTTLLRSQQTGAVTTSLPNTLRLLKYNQYLEYIPTRAVNVFTENQTRKGSQPYFQTVYDVPDSPVLPHGHDEQDDDVDRPEAAEGRPDPGRTHQQQPRHEKHRRGPRLKVRFTPSNQISAVIEGSHEITKPFFARAHK